MTNSKHAAFWYGFAPGAICCLVAMAYVQFAPLGHIVLCTWADACDGGDVWIGYRIALMVFLLLDFPVAAAWSVVPGSTNPLWYHFTLANAVALSAGWWSFLSAVGARVNLWRSLRRTTLIFAGLYLAVLPAAVYLARLIEYYAEAIHGG